LDSNKEKDDYISKPQLRFSCVTKNGKSYLMDGVTEVPDNRDYIKYADTISELSDPEKEVIFQDYIKIRTKIANCR